MVKHTLTDLKLNYEYCLKKSNGYYRVENTDIFSSSWKFSNKKRSGGSVMK